MKDNIAIITALLALLLVPTFPQTAHAQWTKLNQQLYSPAFGQDRLVVVCLPPGYDADRAAPYALLFILGGAQCEENDGFTAQGIDPPIIVGLDNTAPSSVNALIQGWTVNSVPWANSELFGPFEDHVFDVIAHLDSTYNTYGTREKRAVQGGSTTAGGAVRMGLKYPDSFAAVIAEDGFPDLGSLFDPDALGPPNYTQNFREVVLSQQSGPPYNYQPRSGGSPSNFAFLLSGALSPNMNNPPYYIDFFLDTEGNIDESVKSRWFNGHSTRYARELPPGADVKIWVDYMPGDNVGADLMSRAFLDSLDAYGVPYEYLITNCGHGRTCSAAELQSLTEARSSFMAEAMDLAVVGTGIEVNEQPQHVTLLQNYPNPFNPATRIHYSLQQAGRVEIIVTDVLGKKVNTVYSGYRQAGTHATIWTAPAETPSGVYFYTLRSSHGSSTRPMILMK